MEKYLITVKEVIVNIDNSEIVFRVSENTYALFEDYKENFHRVFKYYPNFREFQFHLIRERGFTPDEVATLCPVHRAMGVAGYNFFLGEKASAGVKTIPYHFLRLTEFDRPFILN